MPRPAEHRGSDVTVMLADVEAPTREDLRTVLGSAGGIRVVAEVAAGEELLRTARSHQPDVVVFDVAQAELGGISAISLIGQYTAATAVLVFTAVGVEPVIAAVRAGARGYLDKETERDDIVRAIRNVATGGMLLGARVADRLADIFGASTPHRAPFAELTAREQRVVDLLAIGSSNSTIAAELRLAPKTVRNRISVILTKFNVSTRAEAIVYAQKRQIGGCRAMPATSCGSSVPSTTR